MAFLFDFNQANINPSLIFLFSRTLHLLYFGINYYLIDLRGTEYERTLLDESSQGYRLPDSCVLRIRIPRIPIPTIELVSASEVGQGLLGLQKGMTHLHHQLRQEQSNEVEQHQRKETERI